MAYQIKRLRRFVTRTIAVEGDGNFIINITIEMYRQEYASEFESERCDNDIGDEI